eukprot:803316-Rhodomonas_salina.1
MAVPLFQRLENRDPTGEKNTNAKTRRRALTCQCALKEIGFFAWFLGRTSYLILALVPDKIHHGCSQHVAPQSHSFVRATQRATFESYD